MVKHFGILTSISWNSNAWSAPATQEDIDNSNYDYVKENGWMHEDLNFGHETLPIEEDGDYIGYTPMFRKLPSESESRYVNIVFFRSLNYHNKKNSIVGFYAYPDIGFYPREAEHRLYDSYDSGNIAAPPEHICLFENAIEISNEIILKERIVPPGKKLGQMGFNYLTYENVLNILDIAGRLNPADSKLKKIKFAFLTHKSFRK